MNLQKKNNLRFENISIKQGLSQNVVECILQDSIGFLWIGTQDGLNRYDGKKFSIYRNERDNKESICYNYLRCLFEDKDNKLWIGTDKGLSIYDRSKENFTNYFNDPGDEKSLQSDQIRSVYQDSSGTIWIGTYKGGLASFNPAENNFTAYKSDKDDPESLSDNRVNFITEDTSKNLWVGTWGGGVNVFDRNSERFIRYRLSQDESRQKSFNRVNCICDDGNGNIYIATNYGLFILEKGSGEFRHLINDPLNPDSISDNLVSRVFVDSESNMYIGTRVNGLNIYDPLTGKFTVIKKEPDDIIGLSNNSISAIYEDRSGLIWIGTYGNGLDKLNRKVNTIEYYFSKPGNHDSICSNVVLSICEDSDKLLWIGTHDEGITCFDREKDSYKHYHYDINDTSGLSNNTVNFILEGENDVIWIATHEGLNKLDKRTNKITKYFNDPENKKSLGHNVIFDMTKGNDGIIWLGTVGAGLNRFDTRKDEFKIYKHDPNDEHSISSDRVRCMVMDNDHTIWIGTDGGGLNKFDIIEEKFYRYNNGQSKNTGLSSNNILSIHLDRSGNIWIGTIGSGLNRFEINSSAFKSYSNKDGLPSDTISGILEDDHGNLWISTTFGLSKLDPLTETFRNYDERDGLQGNEFNQLSCTKLRSGELAFGGVNGLNIFNPDELTDSRFIPPAVITNFLIFNKPVTINENGSVLKRSITVEKEITLSHRDNVFSFEFASLDYSAPGKNQYTYKMEGFDKDWVYSGNRGFATYTNLNHGEYMFRVRGSNNDGIWNEEGSSLKIKITPPFRKTLLFKGLSLLALAGMAGSIYRSKLNKVRKENESQLEFTRRLIDVQENDKKRISMELHDSIGQELLFTKNKLLLSFNKPEDNEFILKNITEASEIISETLDGVREISYSLHPYQIERLGLSKAIQSIIDKASMSSEVVFTKSIDMVDKLVQPEAEINIYRIVQECISNILKHSKATEVILNVSRGVSEISILISDNGKGFDQEKIKAEKGKHGFGLKGIAERVKLFEGKFSIITSPGNGAEFLISVPYNA